MKTKQETLLKNHALGQWLSYYDFDKPEEIFDSLMVCEDDEAFDLLKEKYQIDLWQYVEDWDYSAIIEAIQNTYRAAKTLNKSLKEIESCA